jgi:FKBP-type peptidyl-prolyl cis-trans isomerase FklB
MQVGDVYRVEVPVEMSSPKLLASPTIWRIRLESYKKPLPAPEFRMPKEGELETTASGLQYQVIEKGDPDRAAPRMGQEVEVHYAGWMTDGKLFDSSYARAAPARFRLGQVIPGWNEALRMMHPGATYLLVLPPDLAYGEGTPDGTIPPNATLVFYVELLAVLDGAGGRGDGGGGGSSDGRRAR